MSITDKIETGIETAEALTGALIKPEGLTKPQTVTNGLLGNQALIKPQRVAGTPEEDQARNERRRTG